MIGADVLSRLWERPVAPAAAAPAPAPQPASRGFGRALIEFRAALATFDVVDELDRLSREDGYVMTDAEQLAHVYARWSLAGAADWLRRAYQREDGP